MGEPHGSPICFYGVENAGSKIAFEGDGGRGFVISTERIAVKYSFS